MMVYDMARGVRECGDPERRCATDDAELKDRRDEGGEDREDKEGRGGYGGEWRQV